MSLSSFPLSKEPLQLFPHPLGEALKLDLSLPKKLKVDERDLSPTSSFWMVIPGVWKMVQM